MNYLEKNTSCVSKCGKCLNKTKNCDGVLVFRNDGIAYAQEKEIKLFAQREIDGRFSSSPSLAHYHERAYRANFSPEAPATKSSLVFELIALAIASSILATLSHTLSNTKF